MTDWKAIETVEPMLHRMFEYGNRLDLFSERLNIRWNDCGWDEREGSWVSRHKWVDNEGRRCTTFRVVAEPTHWMPPIEGPARSQPIPEGGEK